MSFFRPSGTEKWKSLPSWEKYIKMIDTVNRTEDGKAFVYFKLKGEKTMCREHSSVCEDKFLGKLLELYESKCPFEEFLEPSMIKKWRGLPSWEHYIETICTVEKMNADELVIYFKLKGEKTICRESSNVCTDKSPKKLLAFHEFNLKWRGSREWDCRYLNSGNS